MRNQDDGRFMKEGGRNDWKNNIGVLECWECPKALPSGRYTDVFTM